MTLAAAMLPAWIVIPLAGLTMMLIAIHVLSVQMADMPITRKRLRIASGLLMMVLTAMIAYALGIAEIITDAKAQPARARAFIILWTMIVGMLSFVVMLAVIDAYLTMRHGLIAHRKLRGSIRTAARQSADDRPSAGGPSA